MEIGERIHHYRKMCSLTQEEVAKKLETTPQNIYKYEKGIIKNIPLSSIVLMSELFGVSPAELAGMTEAADGSKSTSLSEKEILGIKLRLKREELGLSVREFAIKLHILPGIINDFESGNYDEINDSLLSKIAEFLGVSVEYFKDGVLPENLGRITLNETERLVVVKYRANPQYRDAIHQLLGITAEDACASDHSHRYKTLTSSDIDSSAPRSRIAQSAKGVYHTEKKED